jgi:hypothetical protein
MIRILADAFAITDTKNKCLEEINDIVVCIYDCIDCLQDLKRSYIKTRDDEPVHFILHNPNAAVLCFAAVDNCLLGPHDDSRCDFIIGNKQKLYFVEIKTNKTRQKHKAREEAYGQLDASIGYLKLKANLINTQIVAVVCLKTKIIYPLRNATSANAIVKFKERHNAQLTEGQEATF